MRSSEQWHMDVPVTDLRMECGIMESLRDNLLIVCILRAHHSKVAPQVLIHSAFRICGASDETSFRHVVQDFRRKGLTVDGVSDVPF